MPPFPPPHRVASTALAIGLLASGPLQLLHAQRGPAAPAPSTLALSAFDSTTFTALSWRNVGPWRGGRSVAVVGLPSNPLTYFAGYTGGNCCR